MPVKDFNGIALTSFQIHRPVYELSQDAALQWLIEAHARAEAMIEGEPAFPEKIARAFRHFGCDSRQITRRGTDLKDSSHTSWDEMDIFNISKESPHGRGMRAKTRFFSRATDRILGEFYPDAISADPPSHLVHVTCTGYAAPSAAQNLVSRKGWQGMTAVTHAYHMGCYAAIPAIRIAEGLIAAAYLRQDRSRARVDIVHNELCSLHLNPTLHTAEQIVVESLFADGHVKYSVVPLDEESAVDGFQLLSTREKIIPDTTDAMTWSPSDWGMSMTLSKEVPRRIAGHLLPFVDELARASGNSVESLRKEALFAIHPGGPKVISAVEELLKLRPEQVSHSKAVLKSYGNMSSATLPHVWERMTKDEAVCPGTTVVSLAFGPGLTVFGTVFKRL